MSIHAHNSDSASSGAHRRAFECLTRLGLLPPSFFLAMYHMAKMLPNIATAAKPAGLATIPIQQCSQYHDSPSSNLSGISSRHSEKTVNIFARK